MDGGVTGALAAVTGAFVGGLASLASTWVSQRSQHRREFLQREITKRESTYSEFIEQASKLHVASATHRINDDDGEVTGVVSLYAVLSRIQLFASDQVIKEAEKVIDRVIRQYGDENLSAEQLRMSVVNKRDDPLKAFSLICRNELKDTQRGRW
jgi:hypothetical protein